MKRNLINYLIACICMLTFHAHAVTIDGPAAIQVCKFATQALTADSSGGTWSSANTTVGSIGSTSGIFVGRGVGTTTVSYTYSGRVATIIVTVIDVPSPIGTAPFTVCTGLTKTLTASGGVWSSSNTSLATISSGGLVTGIAEGIVTISYTASNGCYSAQALTVNASPAPIGSPLSVCSSYSVTLSDATVGGTWKGNPSTVTIDTFSGVLYGFNAAVSTITYTAPNGCMATASFTVNQTPTEITHIGPAAFCQGSTYLLTPKSTQLGGTWASANTSVATVNSSGLVTGVSAGTAVVSYTLSGGCSLPLTVTVNPLPDAGTITGTLTVCAGSTTTLSNAAAGGTWSSSTPAVGTIGSSTGILRGITTGTTKITYATTNSCGTSRAIVTATVQTTASAGSITGTATVCAGATTALADGATGGTWSSTNSAVATVDASGVVTGISAGTTVISYTVTNSCGSVAAVKTVTVNALADPGTITGSSSVCAGSSITLSDGVSGGTWTSSNTAVGTVNASTGVVTGIASGTTTIDYAVTNGCGTSYTTFVVTVNSGVSVPPITGTASTSVGNTTTLSDATYGGTWSSSNTGVATVIAGIVSGVAAGTAVISYTVHNSCGTGVATITVTVTEHISCNPESSCIKPYVYTVAGDAAGEGNYKTLSYSGDGGPATSAQLNDAFGVCVNASGDIFIADGGNNRVRMVDHSTGIITTIAGDSTAGSTGDGGPAINARLNNPIGVACDASGNVYVADRSNNVVRKIDVSGTITLFAGSYSAGYSGDGGAATSAELNEPYNVAVDASGDVYIVDFINNAIRKVSSGTISTFAGTGSLADLTSGPYAPIGDNGPATGAILYHPTSVACDASGNVFIDDENHTRIRKVSSGIITTFAGNGPDTDGFSGDGGPATAAQLNEAYGVAVDACGNVFIADRKNYKIRVVNTSGIINTYAGTTRGYAGDGGLAINAKFDLLYSICIAGNGDLFVADGPNGVIRKIAQECHSGGKQAPQPNVTIASSGSIRCVPNPNNGSFTISRTLAAAPHAKQADIEVMDIMGKVLYRNTTAIENNTINCGVNLGNTIADGVYLVKVKVDGISDITRLTIKR